LLAQVNDIDTLALLILYDHGAV